MCKYGRAQRRGSEQIKFQHLPQKNDAQSSPQPPQRKEPISERLAAFYPLRGRRPRKHRGHEEAQCSFEETSLWVPNGRCSAFHQKESRRKPLGPERSPGRHGPVSRTGSGSESPAAAFPGGPSCDAFGTEGRGYEPGTDPGNARGGGVQAYPPALAGWGPSTQPGDGQGDAAGRERLQCADLAGARADPAKPPSLARTRGGPRAAASQPPWTPGGPPRHRGCAPGSAGGGGAEGARSPAAPSVGLPPSPWPGPAAPPLTCLPGFRAHSRPRPRPRRPQAALSHDGCSACPFKSGSLSGPQRAGAKVPAVARPRVPSTPAPPPLPSSATPRLPRGPWSGSK